MKKFILSASALAVLATILMTATPIRGQQNGGARSAPHQVGLIDMAYVFNNYEKFKAAQQSVKEDFQLAQKKAQGTIEEMKKLSQELSSGVLKADSPEYKQKERRLIQLDTELKTYGQITQRDQLRKEAELYKQIYLEVQDAVRVYAQHYGYTLILRFDRENVEEANDPQKIIQRMTRQVVYHRGQDDLTQAILNHLNRQYAEVANRPGSRPAK